MGWRKTTKIRTAMRSVTTIRKGPPVNLVANCDKCSVLTTFMKLEVAVEASGFTARAIIYLAEAGKIHFRETHEGQVYICRESLLRHERNE